jgi:hypothetical protein
MSAPRYLIWSNEHGAWWRPNRNGYTTVIELAGQYPPEEAKEIVESAWLGGRVSREGLLVAPEKLVSIPRHSDDGSTVDSQGVPL